MSCVKYFLALIAITTIFIGCQPTTDVQTQQILAEMKSKLELLQNQKGMDTNSDSTLQNELRALVTSMKSLKEIVEMGQDSKPSIVGVSEARFEALNKEFLELKNVIANIKSEKDKIDEIDTDFVNVEEKIKKLEDVIVTLESETIRKLFKSQSEILSNLSDSLKRIADATPAEYSKQLQEQNIELSKQIKELVESNKKLEDDAKVLMDKVEKKDEQFKNLNQRYTDLKLAMNKLNAKEPDSNPGVVDDDSKTPQMIQGKVLSFMQSGKYWTTIVSFPKAVKITDNMRFNVFNNKGEKVGFFKVTTPDIDTAADRDYKKCGGEVYLTEGKILEAGFRVSTLASMPNLNTPK